MLIAGAFLVVLPVLVLFAVRQRRFTQSIATTGLKQRTCPPLSPCCPEVHRP